MDKLTPKTSITIHDERGLDSALVSKADIVKIKEQFERNELQRAISLYTVLSCSPHHTFSLDELSRYIASDSKKVRKTLATLQMMHIVSMAPTRAADGTFSGFSIALVSTTGANAPLGATDQEKLTTGAFAPLGQMRDINREDLTNNERDLEKTSTGEDKRSEAKSSKDKTSTFVAADAENCVLDLWNEQGVVVHSASYSKKNWVPQLRKLLRDVGLDDVLNGIRVYGEAYRMGQEGKGFWTYKWTLGEFLQRSNGCRVFAFKTAKDYANKERIEETNDTETLDYANNIKRTIRNGKVIKEEPIFARA